MDFSTLIEREEFSNDELKRLSFYKRKVKSLNPEFFSTDEIRNLEFLKYRIESTKGATNG